MKDSASGEGKIFEAIGCVDKGDLGGARAALSLQASEISDDEVGRALSNVRIGQALLEQGRWIDARDSLNAASGTLEQSSSADVRDVMSLVAAIANAAYYINRGDVVTGGELAHRASSLLRERGDSLASPFVVRLAAKLEARALLADMNARRVQGDAEGARSLLDRVTDEYQKVLSWTDEANVDDVGDRLEAMSFWIEATNQQAIDALSHFNLDEIDHSLGLAQEDVGNVERFLESHPDAPATLTAYVRAMLLIRTILVGLRDVLRNVIVQRGRVSQEVRERIDALPKNLIDLERAARDEGDQIGPTRGLARDLEDLRKSLGRYGKQAAQDDRTLAGRFSGLVTATIFAGGWWLISATVHPAGWVVGLVLLVLLAVALVAGFGLQARRFTGLIHSLAELGRDVTHAPDKNKRRTRGNNHGGKHPEGEGKAAGDGATPTTANPVSHDR